MRSQGLVYYPDLLTAADEAGPSLAGLPQAPISLASREANGYGFYSSALRAAAHTGTSQGGASPEETYADSLPGPAGTRYRLALDGPDSSTASVTFPAGATATLPAGGCLGTAERQIYGSVAN